VTCSKQRRRMKQPPAVQVHDAPGYVAFSRAYPARVNVPSGSCLSCHPTIVDALSTLGADSLNGRAGDPDRVVPADLIRHVRRSPRPG
jgi:hypothetical protein